MENQSAEKLSQMEHAKAGHTKSGRKSAVAFGVGADFGGQILLLLVNLVLTPLMLSLIGSSNYGLWMTILQTVGTLGLLDMGASTAVIQRIANPALVTDTNKLKDFLSASFFIQAATTVIIIGTGLSFSSQFLHLFKVDAQGFQQSLFAFRLMVIWFGISLLIGLFPAILIGRQKIALANLINTGVQLVSNSSVVPLLLLGFGLLAFPMAQWAAGLVGGSIAYIVARKTFPFPALSLKVKAKEVRQVLGFSFFNWVAKIAFMVITASDNILIASIFGTSSVTAYILTSKLSSFIAPNMARIASSALAGFSELKATNNTPSLQSSATALFALAVRVGCMGGVVIVTCTERFVNLWVGKQFFLGTTFVLLLAFICFRDSIIKGVGVLLIASNKMKLFGSITFVEAVAKLVFTYLLCIKFSLGINGILFAQICSTFFLSTLFFPLEICKVINVSKIILLKTGIVRPLIKSLPCLVITIAVAKVLPISWGWFGLVSIGSICVLTNISMFEIPVFLRENKLPLKTRLAAAVFGQ